MSLILTKLDYGITTLAGLPTRQLNRRECLAARLVFSAHKFDHITALLHDLHWLRVPERIAFRLSVLVYRCLHGQGPSYLANDLHRTADVESRRCLRSASTTSLIVPTMRHVTIGYRALTVAAPRAWNSLPPAVTASPSLELKRRLKTELF